MNKKFLILLTIIASAFLSGAPPTHSQTGDSDLVWIREHQKSVQSVFDSHWYRFRVREFDYHLYYPPVPPKSPPKEHQTF